MLVFKSWGLIVKILSFMNQEKVLLTWTIVFLTPQANVDQNLKLSRSTSYLCSLLALEMDLHCSLQAGCLTCRNLQFPAIS